MRIGIQASDLDSARIDGTRVYLSELLKQFGKLSREDSFILYHRRAFHPVLAPPILSNYEEKMIPFPWAWMQTRFALEIFRDSPEKLFLPIQAAPYFLPKKTELTVTVHDLAFKFYPKTFPLSHRIKLNLFLSWAVKRADKIIAVSESTKHDLLHFFPKLQSKKVKVIYHGFNAELFTMVLPDGVLSEALNAFHLEPKNYVLAVGALQPRKNLVRLIEAFVIAKKDHPDMKLVLAGERAWLSKTIFDAAEKSEYRDDILFAGQVSFETLRALYQGARCFVFPSLYEGFGIPILEAFASGTPILVARNSSLPEVAGEAGLYFDAENVSDMAEKLTLLWNDERLRSELREKGRMQLKKFSWDICARTTLEYIRNE